MYDRHMQARMELKVLGPAVQCLFYTGMRHTFHGQGDKKFMQDRRHFFDRYLSGP